MHHTHRDGFQRGSLGFLSWLKNEMYLHRYLWLTTFFHCWPTGNVDNSTWLGIHYYALQTWKAAEKQSNPKAEMYFVLMYSEIRIVFYFHLLWLKYILTQMQYNTNAVSSQVIYFSSNFTPTNIIYKLLYVSSESSNCSYIGEVVRTLDTDTPLCTTL